MKARVDQNQGIADGTAAPSLSDADTLMVPCSVYLPDTLDMARGSHTCLRVVLTTLSGKNHPTTLAMKELNMEIMERETELEE